MNKPEKTILPPKPPEHVPFVPEYGYTVMVEVGGEPVTGLRGIRHTVSGLLVGSSDFIMLDLYGIEDHCVAVREGCNALDFIVRLLVQEGLDNAEGMGLFRLSHDPVPIWDDPINGDGGDNDDYVINIHNTITTQEEHMNQKPSANLNSSGNSLGSSSNSSITDLSGMMNESSLMRDQVLQPRRACFSFFCSEDENPRFPNAYTNISGEGDWDYWENELQQSAKSWNQKGPNYVPVAGDEEDNSESSSWLDQAKDAGRWVTSKVVPESASDQKTASEISIPMEELSSLKIQKPHRGEDPFLPYINMLNKDRWYLVSLHEFRCGQCETKNPLHAMIAAQIMTPINGKVPLMQPSLAAKILTQLHEATPAMCLMIDAYESLLSVVDEMLANPTQINSYLPELGTSREAISKARQTFFKPDHKQNSKNTKPSAASTSTVTINKNTSAVTATNDKTAV